MDNRRRNGVDPSYFCVEDVETKDVNIEDNNNQEEFYDKGVKKLHTSNEVHMTDGDVLILPGEKGESDIHVDIGSARKIVRYLHDKYANSTVKSLSGEAKKRFLTLHEVIEALKGTDAQIYIRDMIISEFKCNHDHHFKIGTVGAYFCKCKGESNFPGNQSCSLGCLLGSDGMTCENDRPCEYTCISYNGDGVYSNLYEVKDVKQAYLFVNDKFKFEGIHPGEYKYFEKLGIEEIKIVKHSDGLSYQEITSDFVPVRNLILQNNLAAQTNGEVIEESSVTIAIIVIIVLIILFAGAGGWYYYKKGEGFSG